MRLLLITMVLLWASPVIACPTGLWNGKATSAIPSINGKAVTLQVSTGSNLCLMRFECPDAGMKEIWELKGNRLTQREIDGKGKVKEHYGATLEVRKGVEGYYLDCPPDRKDKGCDAGGDPRTFWRIDDRSGIIKYEMWGVDPAKGSNKSQRAVKRITYTFHQVK